MAGNLPRLALLAIPLVLGMAIVSACSESETEDAKDTVQGASQDIQKQTKDAWAGLRTDSDRLVDQVQTRNDPEAKKKLLDNCRDSVEKMRKAKSTSADRVNQLCDQIRDADVNNADAWNNVKSRMTELNREIGS